MNPRTRWVQAVVGILLTTSLPRLVFASPAMWQAGTGLFLSSGDYGTDTDTTVMYIPFQFGRVFERGKLDIVIPFISVSSQNDVTIIGGGARPTGRTRTEETTNSGLGDILLRGRWKALLEEDKRPSIDLTTRIKLPTADEDDGLGTGEFDEGVGVEFWKTITGPWSALLDVGYTWTGNPPGQPLNDVWNVSVGAGYRFRETLNGTVSYDEMRAVVPGTENSRDLLFGLSYTPKETVNLAGHLGFGLSDSSPDILVGFNGTLKFLR